MTARRGEAGRRGCEGEVMDAAGGTWNIYLRGNAQLLSLAKDPKLDGKKIKLSV